ncbi:MAG TPA: L-2-hydroxyglutarate oxidase, partial [bacterium]|nr:L-2-hydroxyglutarate oxidase [bacterium]
MTRGEGTPADVAVVGAGIVGLATALQLLEMRPGLRVTVLDKEARVGSHQSGRNSGVIHAGIYYRPGSLKARLCRRGVDLLVRFCRENDVPHEMCGKVVVAGSPEELPALEELHTRGVANGVPGLRMVDAPELRELEPHAAGVRALVSPTTGIVDFGAVTAAMAREVSRRGGEIRLGTAVRGLAAARGELVLETGAGPVRARRIVNCAGLYADRVARLGGPALLDGAPAPEVRLIPFRGEYWTLRPERRSLVSNLIYPVPDPRFPFLGVHFTRRLDGTVEAGPTAVPALAREGYRPGDIHPDEAWNALGWPPFWKMARRYWKTGLGEIARSASRGLLAAALRKLVPDVRAEDLIPGGCGIRAQALS